MTNKNGQLHAKPSTGGSTSTLATATHKKLICECERTLQSCLTKVVEEEK